MKASTPDPLPDLTLWRISNHAELSGLGGERSDGRWHTAERGKRVVYLSANAATALIEVLANLKGDPTLFPDTYQLLKIAAPASLVHTLPEDVCVADWRDRLAVTQAAGNAWLSACASALLAVPSVPAPESTNYLLNALHPDATKLSILSTRRIAYDKRLFHL